MKFLVKNIRPFLLFLSKILVQIMEFLFRILLYFTLKCPNYVHKTVHIVVYDFLTSFISFFLPKYYLFIFLLNINWIFHKCFICNAINDFQSFGNTSRHTFPFYDLCLHVRLFPFTDSFIIWLWYDKFLWEIAKRKIRKQQQRMGVS